MTKSTNQETDAVYDDGRTMSVTLIVNGQASTIIVEPRTTLL
jgi:hypothetical protein